MVASGTDAISDSVLSFSTFVAAIISMIWSISLEGVLGVIISVIIIKSALEILKDTIDEMIGVRADSELVKKLKSKILDNKKVLGVYDLVLHNYGPNNIIGTAHIQLKDSTTAKEIHRITRKISLEVYEEFGIIITLGIYATNDNGKFSEIQKYIQKLTRNFKNIIQVHGFFVDEEEKNVSFDVILNFDEKEPEKIVKEISDKLKEKYPEYNYSVIIDTDFSD